MSSLTVQKRPPCGSKATPHTCAEGVRREYGGSTAGGECRGYRGTPRVPNGCRAGASYAYAYAYA